MDAANAAWVGLFAPAGKPRLVIEQLNAEASKALDLPKVRERLQAFGTDPSPTTPELGRMLARGKADIGLE